MDEHSGTQRRRARGGRLAWSTLAGAGMLVAGACGWILGSHYGGRPGQGPLPVLGQAPHYHLSNQHGRPVDDGRFHGKVQVVTFLFPYCTTYCPLITAHLVGFEHLLARAGLADRVAVVSFNVDPGNTGPAQMRAFLSQYGWNPDDPHWQYLTGSPSAIRRVVTGGFHVSFAREPLAPPGGDTRGGEALAPQPEVRNPLAEKAGVGYDVTHNDALELVDAKGRIRLVRTQADTVSEEELLREVRKLLNEG